MHCENEVMGAVSRKKTLFSRFGIEEKYIGVLANLPANSSHHHTALENNLVTLTEISVKKMAIS